MRIAFVTCNRYPKISESDQHCANILSKRGHVVEAAEWNNSSINWKTFDLVILRSCWDYYDSINDFRSFLDHLKSINIVVFNPLEIILWNCDKKYILDLSDDNIKVPETSILKKGTKVSNIQKYLTSQNWEKLVMKPRISASGMNVDKIEKNHINKGISKLNNALAKTDIILQEFMHEVVSGGEQSYVFFNGVFSHCVLKEVGPNAKPNEFRVNGQYGGISHCVESDFIFLKNAQFVVDSIARKFNKTPLYARIDGVIRDGKFVLMEAELIEPGLFLNLCPNGAKNFADAILEISR